MSMKAMLMAAGAAATLLAPAAAMAQDYGQHRNSEGREGQRFESRRSHDDDRGREPAYSSGYGYGSAYGYAQSYPVYGYDEAYRYAAPVWRDRDDRRDRDHDRDHRRHYRSY